MESIRLTPFFLALLLAGSLVIAANAQSTTSTASPSVTGADSLEIEGGSVDENQEELIRNLIPRDRPQQLPDRSPQQLPDRSPQQRPIRNPVTLPVQTPSRPDLPIENPVEFPIDGPEQLPYPRPPILPDEPGPSLPVCCSECGTNDYSCVINCLKNCSEKDKCEGVGREPYRVFCENECSQGPGAARSSASSSMPTKACRGVCRREVHQLCVANSCGEIVPGCNLSNCSSQAPRRCG